MVYFFIHEVWCIADVSSVSPWSKQTDMPLLTIFLSAHSEMLSCSTHKGATLIMSQTKIMFVTCGLNH